MKTNNNTEQVNGTHYKLAEEPVELMIHVNPLRFKFWAEGEIIKYVTRHHNKNGISDLNKAIHITDMLLDTPGLSYLPKMGQQDNNPVIEGFHLKLYSNQIEEFGTEEFELVKDIIWYTLNGAYTDLRDCLVKYKELVYDKPVEVAVRKICQGPDEIEA